MKKIVLLLSVILYVLISIVHSAGWETSISNSLKDAKINLDEKFKEFYKRSSIEGDFYKQAYNITTAVEEKSRNKAYGKVANYFKSKNGNVCSTINKKDIKNILGNKSGIQNSCMKIVGCDRAMDNIKNVKLKRGQIRRCRESISNLYGKISSKITNIRSMELSNINDGVYTNGDKGDSAYDLMVDVENIANSLFKNAKDQKPKSIYSNYNGGDGSIGNTVEDVFGSNGDGNGDGTNNSSNVNSSNEIIDNSSGKDTENGNLDSGDEIDGNSTENVLGSGNYLCAANRNNSNVIDNYNSGKEDNSDNEDEDEEDSEIDIPLPNTDSPFSMGNLGLDDKDEEEIRNCMNKCKKWDTRCQMKCLCSKTHIWKGEGGDAKMAKFNGEMFVDICVTTKTAESPVKTAPVDNIEEIVEETNNVLKKLLQSGQLMKHEETYDALDTHMKNINFGDTFSFDYQVIDNPLNYFEKKDKKAQKEEDKKDLKKNDKFLKETILGTKGDLNLESERNKYKITPDSSISYIERSLADAGQVEKAMQGENEVEFFKQYDKFIDDNIDMQIQIRNILGGIEQISSSLKQKIEATAK